MSHSISCLSIKAADCWLEQQTSADQLSSYCRTFTVSRHLPTITKYITDLDVSLDGADEQKLLSDGFKKIPVDLNKGAGGNSIHLWYKCGSEPITRIQITFNHDMGVGLINARYEKIHKNLNAGNNGDVIYLWFFKGQTEYDAPIVEIDVTTDVSAGASKFSQGWERLACDLNRHAGGNWIHMWVKREKPTYICDVTATDSYASDANKFEEGYICVDESTNRGARGAPVFIWYRQTTDPKRAVTGLQISTSDDEHQECQQQNYKPVSVNLNEGTRGNPVYLWYKKEEVNKPINAITLLLNTAAVDAYKKAGVTVIKRNLNAGNGGSIEYLCVYQ